MSEPIELSEAQLVRLADLVAERMGGAPAVAPAELWRGKPVLTVRDAMAYTGHRSASSFYRWARRRRVKPLEQGRYSVRRLESALVG